MHPDLIKAKMTYYQTTISKNIHTMKKNILIAYLFPRVPGMLFSQVGINAEHPIYALTLKE